MRVKVGNQKAAQYMILDGRCQRCAFSSYSLNFCILYMNCDVCGSFYQTEDLEDIFKL